MRPEQALRHQVGRGGEDRKYAGDEEQVRERHQEEGLVHADVLGPAVNDGQEAGHDAGVRDADVEDHRRKQQPEHRHGQGLGPAEDDPEDEVNDASLAHGARDHPQARHREDNPIGEGLPSLAGGQDVADGEEEGGGHEHAVGGELLHEQGKHHAGHPHDQVAPPGQLGGQACKRQESHDQAEEEEVCIASNHPPDLCEGVPQGPWALSVIPDRQQRNAQSLRAPELPDERRQRCLSTLLPRLHCREEPIEPLLGL
mmetsp:Transcript_3969/g.11926  ORF Transcript_3969/g.11926 Transcript_3969/m.11926 type:complete len:256 (+) Transcript_3969:1643-2410(+)